MKRSMFCFIVLVSMCTAEAKDYKGAELRTKESFLYGRFEVCYQASRGAGQLSTFFTYNDDYPNTPWNEIDIEILGRYTDDVQFNPKTFNGADHVRHQFVDFDPTLDFHRYAFEWTPDYVAFFIDDQEVARQTGDHIRELYYPQKIMMNIWCPASEDWAGTFDKRILPVFAYYDYVRYAAYTPGQGDVGTSHDFSHEWIDQFDSLDTTRWETASHTFGGNNADFIGENCHFADGKMILCLTDNVTLGYHDKTNPSVLSATALFDTVFVRFSENVTAGSLGDPSNYMIRECTIDSVQVLSDMRTVKLFVSGMEYNQCYNLIVSGIDDLSDIPNRLLGQVTPVIRRTKITFPLKVNVGGQRYGEFLADLEFSHESEYGFCDGWVHDTVQPIANTSDDSVFSCWRQGLAAYRVRVPSGQYKLTLQFAENQCAVPHERVFDVYVEDTQVLNDLDIFQEAGMYSAYEYVISDFPITDQQLDIHFSCSVGRTALCGFILEPVNSIVNKTEKQEPADFNLGQNYPNPFNAVTVIPYTISRAGDVSLTIYDLKGNTIDTLERNHPGAGTFNFKWTAAAASGIYFYRIQYRSHGVSWSDTGKMTLIK